MIGDIISFRHHLHAHPELSGHEKNTHDVIAAFLRKLQPTVLHEHVGGYGLVAVFGDAGAEAVAFRADIDALPICETLPLPYASESPDVSHKCGHDGHTAILLRLAEKLSERMRSGSLPCTAVLVFQPAEETGEGSRRILEAGVLDRYRISAFYGLIIKMFFAESEHNPPHIHVVYGEMNAILNYRGSRKDLEDAKIYVDLFPCNECAKLIIHSGIKEIIYICDKYKNTVSFFWFLLFS